MSTVINNMFKTCEMQGRTLSMGLKFQVCFKQHTQVCVWGGGGVTRPTKKELGRAKKGDFGE